MKGKILLAGFGAACFGLGGLVVAATSGIPEIDRANAKITLQGNLQPVQCKGEDSTGYETFSGSLTGSESQVTPDATDYSLSGPVTVAGVKWTINLTTKRGVLTGGIALGGPAGPVYKGVLVLISQGLPVGGAAPSVPARGWINAGFTPTDEGGSTNDDKLLANTEFKLGFTGATGQFGNLVPSLGYGDFSVVTNVPTQTC